MSSLKVVAIKPIHDVEHPPMKHPVLPQHEFGLLIVAPPGSGKTNLICNLLLNHFKGYFHEVWICSPTVKNDPKWERVLAARHVLCENKKLKKILGEKDKKTGKDLPKIVHKSEGDATKHLQDEPIDNKFDGRIPETDVFDDLNEIPKRLEQQHHMLERLEKLGYESSKAKYLINRVLLIEDDCAGLYRNANKSDPLTNAVFKRRHFGCSMIKVTQQFNAMPAAHRIAMGALILFDIPNKKELETIYESYQMGLDRNEWQKVYDYCTRKPFSFLYYNCNFPKGQRLYRNFDELLRVDDEDSDSQQSVYSDSNKINNTKRRRKERLPVKRK